MVVEPESDTLIPCARKHFASLSRAVVEPADRPVPPAAATLVLLEDAEDPHAPTATAIAITQNATASRREVKLRRLVIFRESS